MKSLKFRHYDVDVRFDTYACGGTLATILMDKKHPGEIVAVVTVNLPASILLDRDEAFVDTNNVSDIEQWLVDNSIATPLGFSERSGFCMYPAYKFNLNFNKD